MSRTRRAAALVALAAAAAVLAVAPPAAAAADPLQVSTDGVTFTASDLLPVYPDALRLVPGDTESASVWVRNAGSSPARLRLELLSPQTSSDLLAANVTLAATPAGDARQTVTVAAGIANGACTVLGSARVLGVGETVRIDVTADMSASLTGTQAAQQSLGFALGATLFDAAAAAPQEVGAPCVALPDTPDEPGASGASGGSGGGGAAGAGSAAGSGSAAGDLARTGGQFPVIAAAIGGAGLLAGILVFLFARRRREVEDDSREH